MEFTAIDYANFGVTGAVVIFMAAIWFMGSEKAMEDLAEDCFDATLLYAAIWAGVELVRWLGGWPHYVHLQGAYCFPLAAQLAIWGVRKKGWKILKGIHPLVYTGSVVSGLAMHYWLERFDLFYETVAMAFGQWLAGQVLRLVRLDRQA